MTIAWITGGGTGIGLALAEQLIQQGSKVIITGRRKDVLDQAVQRLRSLYKEAEVLAIAGDAANPAHAAEVVSKVESQWGSITLLINNAGSNMTTNISETPFEEYQQSFEANCLSAINCFLAVSPGMGKSGGGTVVNISSVYGKWASSSSASYAVGKYALTGYTDALRQGFVGSAIHVLGVYPGFIRTAMTMPFVVPGSLKSRLGKTPEQMAKAILSAVKRKKSELYFPWYVSWVLRLHRWFPKTADRVALRIKR